MRAIFSKPHEVIVYETPIDRKLFAFRRNERACATISFEIVLVNVWSILMNQSGNNSVFIINSVKTEPACLRLIYFSTWYKLWNRMSTCYRSMLWRHVIVVNTTVIWLWDPFICSIRREFPYSQCKLNDSLVVCVSYKFSRDAEDFRRYIWVACKNIKWDNLRSN